ncbi:unnamed protein product [Cochlearia groenlandica]
MAHKISSKDKSKGNIVAEEPRVKRSRGGPIIKQEEEPTPGFAFPRRTNKFTLLRDTKNSPFPRNLYDSPMEEKFETSFFPDPKTVTKLGILDEVRMILGNMGIVNTLGISYDVYQEVTCMFLATLEVVLDNIGSQVAQNTCGDSIRFTDSNKGRSKSSQIRHIAVRYVQKLLSREFFPRRETCQVNNNEVIFLQQGVPVKIRRSPGRNHLFPTIEELRPSTIRIFLRGAPCIILLPNEECTSFEYNDVISFQPSSRFFATRSNNVSKLYEDQRKKVRPAGPRVHEREPINRTVYGSERYYSRPTYALRQHGPLQDMYVEMRRMTCCNKFQERVIRKLVNEAKSLKKEISRGASCASCSSNQNLQMVVKEPLEESSSQVAPPARQRRYRHYIHSPPRPESENESPTFSTDEDFDSSRYYYLGNT